MIELLLYCIVAIVAGMLTFMAPCTLPILPAYFAFSTTSGRSQVTSNTMFFALGLASMFTVLGVAAGTVGRLVLNYKREIVYIFGAIIILFGVMSILGKNIKLFKTQLKSSRKPWESFVFGGLFGLTWSGCIGPVLGFMLILAASTQTVIGGGLLLFMYAMGLVFPLILLSVYIDRLPKEGRVWTLLRGKLFEIKINKKKYYIHSTNLISGILFISLGVFLILEANYALTSLLPYSLTEWVFDAQDALMEMVKFKWN